MKKTIAILAATALTAGAAPAMAQEVNSTFTGPRVEGIIGYDISRAGSSTDNDTNTNDDESIDGVMYGVGAGYDFSAGGVLVGVEGEYTDSSAKTGFDNGDFEGFGLGRVETGRDLYIGARVGAIVAPNTLAYVKGGYTNARYNILASDGETELRTNFDTDGYRLGAGVEVAFSPNLFTKFEYRYSNYSEGELDFENDNVPDSQRFDIDLDRHQIVAGVGYRF